MEMRTVSGFTAPVVVGVDGGAPSLAALAWARDEAVSHGAPLVVVHVLDPRPHAATYAPTCISKDSKEEDALAAAAAEGLIAMESVSPAEHLFVVGVPSAVLVERSRGARLLVLGHSTRHRHAPGEAVDGQEEPAMGPVSRACLGEAECPVLILPEPIAHY